MERQTLIATINGILAAPPRSKEMVERIFGEALRRRPPPSSPNFWVSNEIALSDSVVTVDYAEWPAGIGLTLAVHGICFTSEQVRERFSGSPALVLGSVHAPRPSVTLEYRQSWGQIGFTFPSSGSPCLDRIAIDISGE